MKHLKLSWALALLAAAFGLSQHVRADSIINNFTTSYDYVANGIIGDTNWDGVYMNFGDIPGGNNGGDANGITTIANANVANSGFLTVQSTAGTWAAAGDDGFYLYKVVSGDFDASVQVSNPYQTPGFHLPGILARAWSTNNSGAPYSPSSTNAPSENWIYNARFQEFSISEHGRYATNGADRNDYFNTPGANADTNTPRYVRITRVGDVFNFYEKTNQTDTYVFITNLTRTDLHNVPMQVGIEDSTSTTAGAGTFFTDFELSGPNVSLAIPSLAGTPSAIVTTATNTGGSLTFSWTVGNPGDGSLVVIRQNGHIQVNPVQGLAYTADTAFGASDALMGGGQSVVYAGTGNSVTVTNLGANNTTYAVAVYEFTNNAGVTNYNTISPATNFFVGPGVITSAFLVVPTNNIPVQGAVNVRLFASFSTGQTSDQTVNAVWMTSDATIATVDAAGTVSGIANGSVTLTGTFGPFAPTATIKVHSPVFVDNFTSVHDYVANGLAGSLYDGMFLNFNDFPGQFVDATGPGHTTVLDSQISSTNGLQFNSFQSDWQGIRDDGPFLFKIVPGSRNGVSGDFEASMQVVAMNQLNFAKVGIMARLFDPNTASYPAVTGENHINYYKVQNGATTINGTTNATAAATVNVTFVGAGPAPADNFLLMQRVNATNFYFYERAATNAPWIFVTNIVFVDAANDAPMEVGIVEETRSGVTALATVGSFMLDAAGVVSATQPPPAATSPTLTLNGDLSMTLNWVAADNLGNPVQSVAVMRAGAPVSAQPTLGQSLSASSAFGAPASGLGAGNYVVFDSGPSPASTNNTVTVSNLAPGVTYYAAIFTYTGSGSTAVFNTSVAVSPPLVTDGFLIRLTGSLAGGIPVGGIGQLLVQAFYSAGTNPPVPVDVSAVAAITSGNTNIVKILAGVLTGITNGVVPVTNTFGGFTNVASVTVRNPFFTDFFTTAHDYLANGVAGTGWDDLYNPRDGTNPVPGSAYVPLALSGTTVADANISTNDMLTLTSAGDGWENNVSGGFFLFKYVPGDFQAAVHINSFDVAGFNQPGILARGYTVTNGLIGAPIGLVLNATNFPSEYWEDLTRFDEFGIGTYARDNVDNTVNQNIQPDPGDTNFWLLVIRSRGTNFGFFKRLNPTDPWKRVPNGTTYSHAYFAGQPMQVGLMAGAWTGNSGTQRTVRFEDFMLDTVSPALTVTRTATNVIVSWSAIPGLNTLQHSTSLSPQNWQPVAATPVLNAGVYSVTIPSPVGRDFFRVVP
jgi:hypothetical protein